FAESIKAVRRTAVGNGLRLVQEVDGEQHVISLTEESVYQPLRDVVAALFATEGEPQVYLKVGRKVARISPVQG
ncbi:hypothetical protein PT931_25355, partial [Longispora urticae]